MSFFGEKLKDRSKLSLVTHKTRKKEIIINKVWQNSERKRKFKDKQKKSKISFWSDTVIIFDLTDQYYIISNII